MRQRTLYAPESAAAMTMKGSLGVRTASNTSSGDFFGTKVTLTTNGDTLAVGAPNEDSTASGIGGNQSDNSGDDTGAVYLFQVSP